MAAQPHPRSLDRNEEMHLISHQQPPAFPPGVAIMPPSLPLQSNTFTSTTAAAATAATASSSSYPPSSSVTAMGGAGGLPVLLQQRSPQQLKQSYTATTPPHHHHHHHHHPRTPPPSSLVRKTSSNEQHHRTLTKYALLQNDSMVYLDGPNIYTCNNCRTHLTSHDDIISKSFHGRHGRAYLFDQCVNITHGPAEDRILITGLHSVSDIYCQRCKTLIGWTYNKAYETSQKYKEKKYIIEKIYLHFDGSDGSVYDGVAVPAGEKCDKFRSRSMSWGSSSSTCGSNTSREGGERGGVSIGSYGDTMTITTPTVSSSSTTSWFDSPGYYSRSRSGSGGSPYTIRTTPPHYTTTTPAPAPGSSRGSPTVLPPIMSSPSLPNDVIYEYR